jgi:uncharacterized damage-inducible protein DinB
VGAPEAPEPGSKAQAEARPALSGGEFAAEFIAASRRYLCEEYPAKLDRALQGLTHEDVWWRPTPATNSIGHLLRHLSGNVRQWIVHGLGGEPDTRDRASEFASPPIPIDAVRAALRDTLTDADRVLRDLSPRGLEAPLRIQGLDTTVGEAVYHVVEHFSMHTGQVLWIAKVRTGRDLGLYEVDERGHVIGTHW